MTKTPTLPSAVFMSLRHKDQVLLLQTEQPIIINENIKLTYFKSNDTLLVEFLEERNDVLLDHVPVIDMTQMHSGQVLWINQQPYIFLKPCDMAFNDQAPPVHLDQQTQEKRLKISKNAFRKPVLFFSTLNFLLLCLTGTFYKFNTFEQENQQKSLKKLSYYTFNLPTPAKIRPVPTSSPNAKNQTLTLNINQQKIPSPPPSLTSKTAAKRRSKIKAPLKLWQEFEEILLEQRIDPLSAQQKLKELHTKAPPGSLLHQKTAQHLDKIN